MFGIEIGWITWLVIAIVAVSIEKCLNRYFLSTYEAHWDYMLGYNFGALLLTLIFVSTSLEFKNDPIYTPLLVLSGMFWFASCLFSFKADRFVELTITGLISQLQLILVFIGGLLFFKESITEFKIAGAGIILLGLMLLIKNRASGINNGIAFKFIAVILLSVAILLDKKVVGFYTPVLVAISGYLVPLFLTVLFKPSLVKTAWSYTKKVKYANVMMGAVGCLSYYALISSFKNAEISVVFPMFQLNIITTFLLGIFLLKEKDNLKRKVISSIFILIGAVLLNI